MSTTNQKAATPAATTEQPVEVTVSGVKMQPATKIKYRDNPKRNGSASWERYEKYQTATTWAQYEKLNDGKFKMADARHDLGKGFLEILK